MVHWKLQGFEMFIQMIAYKVMQRTYKAGAILPRKHFNNVDLIRLGEDRLALIAAGRRRIILSEGGHLVVNALVDDLTTMHLWATLVELTG